MASACCRLGGGKRQHPLEWDSSSRPQPTPIWPLRPRRCSSLYPIGVMRRHIRLINIIGGTLLIALGTLMVTGLWTALMSNLQGVFLSVPLPI